MGGGPALFAGANYQTGVTAHTLVHMLANRSLAWLAPLDVTPTAVSSETGGPGDDIRVEFGAGRVLEAQAKSGLQGNAALLDAIRGIFGGANELETPVVLVVDRRSSSWIYGDFVNDLDRIRSGRTEPLRKAGELYLQYGDALGQLHVTVLDVAPPNDVDAVRARELLQGVLEDPDDVGVAWAVLLEVSGDLSQRQGRIDRAGLVVHLTERGIGVRPPSRDEPALRRIDFATQLRKRGYTTAALSELNQLGQELRVQTASREVQYRLARQRAAALNVLNQPSEALRAAQTALDIRPQGTGALVAAASAALELGDLEAARRYADVAAETAPSEPRAWAAVAIVRAAAEEPLPEVPEAVASSELFRTVCASIAMERRDFQLALGISEALLQDGIRTPGTLILRAGVLLESNRDPVSGRYTEQVDIERLATEAIEGLEDAHPQMTQALLIRATVRKAAGRAEEADDDLARAERLDPSDARTIRARVVRYVESGDFENAIGLLSYSAGASEATLIALRAKLLASRGQDDSATAALKQALALLPDAPNEDEARIATADAALEIGDKSTAARIYEGLSAKARSGPAGVILAAQLSAANGDIERAVSICTAAIEHAGSDRDRILIETAMALYSMGHYEEAGNLFKLVNQAVLVPECQRMFIDAMIRVGDYAGAQSQIDVLAAQEQLPAWALEVAVNIALMRDDPTSAIVNLTQLIDSGLAGTQSRVLLAHLLLEEGLRNEASAQVDALVSEPDLNAVQRMQLAQLLQRLGRTAEVGVHALRAFRDGRDDDPQIHRAIVGLVFIEQIDLPSADSIGADTFVRLRDEHGSDRVHVILADPPYSPSRNEISVVDADTMGLLGRSVGSDFVEGEGTFQEKRWTIVEILPALLHFAQDAFASYAQRFPSEPFFVTSIHVGDGSAPGDHMRLLQSLTERRDRVEAVLAAQREQVFPLSLAESLAGVSVTDIMNAIATEPKKYGPLWVEWGDRSGQLQSLNNAREAQRMILTRSCLKTIFDLEIADIVSGAYDLVVPRSLMTQLRQEELEAQQQVDSGRRTLIAGEIGVQFEELDAGHPLLVQRFEELQALCAWLTENVHVESRPLEWVRPDDIEPTSPRLALGEATYDALILAMHLGESLYADDLGLRRIDLGSGPPQSFSSISLLTALAERERIDASTRDQCLVNLAVRGYMHIPPSPGILLAALGAVPSLNGADLARVFSSLSGPATVPREAARISAQACRIAALDTVQVSDPARIALLALEALVIRVSPAVARRLLEEEATRVLIVMPLSLDSVLRVCRQFGR